MVTKIKLIKECYLGKVGDIINVDDNGSKIVIEDGFAEEIKETKKETIQTKTSPINDTKEQEMENELEDYVGWSKKGFYYVKVDNVVSYLMEKYSFKTIYGKKSEDVWMLDNGIWLCKGKEIIKTETEKLLGEHSKIRSVNEIYEKIKRLTAIPRDEFENTPEELLCLENGVLNVKTKELLPFNPDYNFKTKLPIVFNPESKCPNILKFIHETFYKDNIYVIQEWLGYHLYKRYFEKKAIILFGEKNTGKSVFINLLIKFVGEKNKTGINLQHISRGDKFTLSALHNKLANIYDDLSFRDLQDGGGFKVATGGSYITAEYKFGDTFEFLNFAKHTFSTNKIPVLQNVDDDAYYLRWIPIPCDNEIDEDKQDKFLLDKITTKEELAGLLNWALDGLKRLLENRKFTFSKSVEEIRDLMEKHSNQLSAFVQDCLKEDENGRISKELMYELYTIYAKLNKTQILTKEQIGRQLLQKARFIADKRDRGRYWAYAGIKEDAPKEVKEYYEKYQLKENSIASDKGKHKQKDSLEDYNIDDYKGGDEDLDSIDTF